MKESEVLRPIQLTDGSFAIRLASKYGWMIGNPQHNGTLIYLERQDAKRRSASRQHHIHLSISRTYSPIALHVSIMNRITELARLAGQQTTLAESFGKSKARLVEAKSAKSVKIGSGDEQRQSDQTRLRGLNSDPRRLEHKRREEQQRDNNQPSVTGNAVSARLLKTEQSILSKVLWRTMGLHAERESLSKRPGRLASGYLLKHTVSRTETKQLLQQLLVQVKHGLGSSEQSVLSKNDVAISMENRFKQHLGQEQVQSGKRLDHERGQPDKQTERQLIRQIKQLVRDQSQLENSTQNQVRHTKKSVGFRSIASDVLLAHKKSLQQTQTIDSKQVVKKELSNAPVNSIHPNYWARRVIRRIKHFSAMRQDQLHETGSPIETKWKSEQFKQGAALFFNAVKFHSKQAARLQQKAPLSPAASQADETVAMKRNGIDIAAAVQLATETVNVIKRLSLKNASRFVHRKIRDTASQSNGNNAIKEASHTLMLKRYISEDVRARVTLAEESLSHPNVKKQRLGKAARLNSITPERAESLSKLVKRKRAELQVSAVDRLEEAVKVAAQDNNKKLSIEVRDPVSLKPVKLYMSASNTSKGQMKAGQLVKIQSIKAMSGQLANLIQKQAGQPLVASFRAKVQRHLAETEHIAEQLHSKAAALYRQTAAEAYRQEKRRTVVNVQHEEKQHAAVKANRGEKQHTDAQTHHKEKQHTVVKVHRQENQHTVVKVHRHEVKHTVVKVHRHEVKHTVAQAHHKGKQHTAAQVHHKENQHTVVNVRRHEVKHTVAQAHHKEKQHTVVKVHTIQLPQAATFASSSKPLQSVARRKELPQLAQIEHMKKLLVNTVPVSLEQQRAMSNARAMNNLPAEIKNQQLEQQFTMSSIRAITKAYVKMNKISPIRRQSPLSEKAASLAQTRVFMRAEIRQLATKARKYANMQITSSAQTISDGISPKTVSVVSLGTPGDQQIINGAQTSAIVHRKSADIAAKKQQIVSRSHAAPHKEAALHVLQRTPPKDLAQKEAMTSLKDAIKGVEKELLQVKEQAATPQMNIKQLTDQMYREFSRRMRLEQQRRGL
ncbi:hypothetical protein [Paenibacillus sp. GXUN7292]|uniref:hypothetical protein n=1 Tax=Paenibacillus sp. GXUN7292 TaxID=3422499 RepID=UPI003D7D1058